MTADRPDHWRGVTGTPLIALLTAIVAIGPLSISFYVPSLPDIARSLGATPGEAQATMTTYLAGFAIAQLIYGPLSDKHGRRPVLVGALLLFILATAVCAMTQTIEQLLAARFVQGFGACCGPILGRAMVRDLFDGPAMVRVFAIVGASVAIAPALAPSIGGVIEQAFGWEASFLSLALIAVILLLLALLFLDESNRHRTPDAVQPRRLIAIYAGLLRNTVFMSYVLCGALIFSGVFGYHATAAFVIMGEMGLSPAEYGLLAIITVPAYMAGNITSGRLAGRVPARVLIGCGIACAATGAVLLETLSGTVSLPRILGPMMVYFLGFGLILPNCIAGALQPFPRVAGSASATMGFIQMACGALSSIIAALVYQGSGMGPFGWLLIGLSCLAALNFILLVPREATPPKGM